METSLHRQLKESYALHASQCEVAVGRYRADVVRGDEIVEIQASSLAAISQKTRTLAAQYRVLIVKPVPFRTRIVRLKPGSRQIVSKRFSPRRGQLSDLFEELVHFTKAFPHSNLTIEVLFINQEEIRIESRRARRKKFQVVDKKLLDITQTLQLKTPTDLIKLMPRPIPHEFTTKTLADVMNVSEWRARMIAYTLRHCGTSQIVGKVGNRLVYELDKAA